MNNELLKELIEKAATSFGNELVEVLEEDFDAKIVHEDQEEDHKGINNTTVLQIGDLFVQVDKVYLRLGYKDYDFDQINAFIVNRYENIVTKTVISYIQA